MFGYFHVKIYIVRSRETTHKAQNKATAKGIVNSTSSLEGKQGKIKKENYENTKNEQGRLNQEY